MNTWSIADTRELVGTRFGKEHLAVVAPILNSLSERLEYARYHYHEVKRLLDDFSSRYLAESSLLIVAHGQNHEHRADFDSFMIHVGAHSLACVLSIHSLADVMANAVYQSLGYGLAQNPLPDRKISLHTVQALLAKSPAHASIAALLDSLRADDAYKHVAALANRSKHQSVVKPLLNEDWTGARLERHEVRLSGFRYGGKSYPEAELTSLLRPAFEAASRITVQVGNELHRVLAQYAA